MISAKIIADSISESGHRLTTFVCVFPRIVLAEFNTHRMLSRNSASSRAIPFKKMVEMVKTNPFVPIKWMKDHKGMQGNQYFEGTEIELLRTEWLQARNFAVQQAEELSEAGLTKQIVNRLLEPFMWHTVIVTGTEWENFFALRAHEAAEIHIQDLAHKMLEAYNSSSPQLLRAGEWHIPFGDKLDEERLFTQIEADHGVYDPVIAYERSKGNNTYEDLITKYKVKIATARCARVSYLNFEGKDDYEADIKLHDQLLEAGHMSPFEHCARAMDEFEYKQNSASVRADVVSKRDSFTVVMDGTCGNFRGFIQYRKIIPYENKSDNRVKRISYE